MASATKIVASIFGAIVALAGLEHGIGEILQGSVPPPSLVFESWPESQLLSVMAGEPAMSLLPNLLVAGILTVLLSLLTLGWSVTSMGTKYGGAVLMLLAVLLLLVGGGIAPPLMGLIAGAAATRINRPVNWWTNRIQHARPPLLAKLWPYILAASVTGYLALLPGIPILATFTEVKDPAIVGYLALFSFLSLILSVIAALAWDGYHSRGSAFEAASQ